MDIGSKSATWFALYTRHQHEKVVAQYLSRKGMIVLLPLYTEAHRWKDRVREVSLPLFPNYVFVSGGFERKAEVLSMPGIYDFVRFGGSPAPIPGREIEMVRRVVERGQHVEPYPFLNTGDRVRVKSEPLKGLEGILIRRKNSYRLVLSIELLARSIAVEVDAFDVEPVIVSSAAHRLPAIAAGFGREYEETCTRKIALP